MQHYYYYTAW